MGPFRVGGALSAADYGAVLDFGPRALCATPVLARALGAGWSRGDVVLPRLERWLAGRPPYKLVRREGRYTSESSGASDTTEPARVIKGVLASFCEGGTLADVRKLQALLQKRIEAHPAERFYQIDLAGSPKEQCPSGSALGRAAPVTHRASSAPVLFGD